MKRYTPEELAEVLRLHRLWVEGEEGGARADLSRADLSGANLSRSNLSRANLSRTNLCDAVLCGSNLAHANLAHANLDGADLSRTNLYCADLSRASLRGANLSRTNLYCAIGYVPFVEVGPIGSRNDRTRFTPSTGAVVCGCFRGSLDEFEAAVLKTHADGTEYRRQYLAAISMFRALEVKP